MAGFPRNIPKASSFFEKVMSYKIAPKAKQRAVVQKTVRRGGRGFRKLRKVKKGVEKEIKDIMKVSLTGNIRDSSKHTHDFYEEHLKHLSKRQISRFLKKINAIAHSLLDYPEDYESFERVRQLSVSAIILRLKLSEENIKALQRRIRTKLGRMQPLKLTRETPPRIQYNNKKYAMNQFAREYFQNIIDSFDQLASERLVIPEHHNETGMRFVCDTLLDRIS